MSFFLGFCLGMLAMVGLGVFLYIKNFLKFN